MTRRFTMMFAIFVLVASACSSADGGGEEVAAGDGGGSSTTVAPTSTSAAVTATTTSPSTTEAPAPTTTMGTSSEAPEVTALRAAFAASAEITSGRMEGTIEVSGLDPSQGLTEMAIPFGGAFDNASGDSSFYMDMSGVAAAAGEEIPPELAELFGEMEVRQIGDTSFVKFGFFNMFLGAETSWIAMPADESDPTGGFSMTSPGNPSEILGSFEEAGAEVEVIGTEVVNGVNATHYRAVFDMETLIAEATPEERAELEAQGPLPVDVMPMDVWISDDGLVIRFVMEIDGDSVETDPVDSFGHMLMRYDMFDLNADVVIEPPPPEEVTHVDDLEMDFGFDV